MKRFLTFFLALFLVISSHLRADEGMWLLPLIQKYNIATMQSMGLELTAEQIYSINQSSLKDAIVQFGRGCTGEVISDKGLILTNHHCGYGVIQSHSSTENDYLKNGFWAMSLDEEIPSPGLSVTFLVRIEDVTDKVNGNLKESMTEEERAQELEKAFTNISSEATKDTHYTARVQSFYGGNKFYLMVYEVFNDVRMVGAPPSSIGKFGADTDNWMWPRHTGDFAIFRVYADKDNKPSAYSADNVPYKPKHHLPVSLKGVEKGDFTMILGYPGRTDRFMTSWEVDETESIINSNRSYIRGIRQELLLEDMLASDEIRIKYANKYSRSSNYWKYSIGQNMALKSLNVKENKEKSEADFSKWVAANKKRTKAYGEALSLIQNALINRNDLTYTNLYINETLYTGVEIFGFASRLEDFYEFLSKGEDGLDSRVERIKQAAKAFYKDYNVPTDRKVAKTMLELFAKKVKEENHPDFISKIKGDFNGNFEAYVNHLFENSFLTDSVKFFEFLSNPTAERLMADPAYAASQSIRKVSDRISDNLKEINQNFRKGHRLYIAGIMEMNEGKPMYPDANSTMRITYGQVLDYYPRDAVHYNYITTLKGVMEKEDPNNWEFVVPEKLKTLYNNRDFGPYGMKNGDMPIAFISNNDITGGNSGSPVINSKGHIIGCAFDGNWEAMSGDIIFEPDYQRTISVDIRYVLFIIDKYAGAKHLVDEMTIIQ